jgi:hypothetical protein
MLSNRRFLHIFPTPLLPAKMTPSFLIDNFKKTRAIRNTIQPQQNKRQS